MAPLLIVLALAVVAMGFLLYQILRQQGRMLLRLDELERVVSGAVGTGGHAAPVGPPVGSALDAFAVVDLEGREVPVPRVQRKRALLVNWSPTCGYCEQIAPQLAELRPALDKAGVDLLLLAHGDAETNRAGAERHGLMANTFLLANGANPTGFHGVGTPAALLVDGQGKVASPLVIGADKVPAFAQELATTKNGAGKLRGQRPLSESRLVRDGLKAGTPAPLFELPDVYGNLVSLADYRGRLVLLVLTDPQCGPCDALAPHLNQLDEPGSPAVILVGRGDVAENRTKAEANGFRFPVIVQDGWKLSKEYGIFATPVAFLIDERGIIARDVATGYDEILALLREGAPV